MFENIDFLYAQFNLAEIKHSQGYVYLKFLSSDDAYSFISFLFKEKIIRSENNVGENDNNANTNQNVKLSFQEFFELKKLWEKKQRKMSSDPDRNEESQKKLYYVPSVDKVVKSAVFVGDNFEIAEFADKWLGANNIIYAIISDDKKVKNWARSAGIKCFPYSILKDEVFVSNAKNQFDFLLSIINHVILKEDILNLPRQGCINYHAAPLPQYKGVYGTSWAIYNQEPEHWVSWHWMAKEVDSGDVILKSDPPIKITDDQTAYGLEINCLEQAKKSFSELIVRLCTDKELRCPPVSHSQQNFQETEYKIKDKLPGNGLIDWNMSVQQIMRIYRALNISKTEPNYFGILKIILGSKVFYPNYVSIAEAYKENLEKIAPGTITFVNKDNLRIACYDGVIQISQLASKDGKKIPDVAELLKSLNLKAGEVLPAIPHEIFSLLESGKFWGADNESLYEHRVESAWVRRIQNIESTFFGFNINTECEYSENGLNIFDSKSRRQHFLESLILYLGFINQTDQITIGYVDSEIQSYVGRYKEFLADILPLNLNLKICKNNTSLSACLSKKIEEIKEKKTFLHDVILRYPAISQANLKYAVILQYVDNFTETNLIKSAPLVISINSQNKNEYLIRCYPDFISVDDREDFICFMKDLVKSVENNVWNVSFYPVSRQLALPPVSVENKNIKTARSDNIHSLVSKANQTGVAVTFVIDDDTKQTCDYSQLESRANSIANELIKNEIKLEKPVVVLLPPSIEWVASVLGVLKAGGAYIPVLPKTDENSFNKHNKYIFKNSEAKFAITNMQSCKGLTEIIPEKKCIFVETIGTDPSQEKINKIKVAPKNLAYIIYTSGSTGKPKGVQIEHHNIIFSTLARIKYYGSDSEFNVLPLTNLVFDATTAAVFWILAIGGTLTLLPDNSRSDQQRISKCLANHSITHLFATPMQYERLLNFFQWQSADIDKIKKKLKAVILGGEKLPADLVKKHSEIFPAVELYNEYGPTECTIWTTVKKVYAKELIGSSIPSRIDLGSPIDSEIKLYIFDEKGRALPRGISGELCISGPNVSIRGYRNKQDETSEHFCKLTTHLNDRIVYRTGDIVRYSYKNELIFIGRNNEEIKKNGMRIKLGDIELKIKQLLDARDVAVVFKAAENLLWIFVVMSERDNANLDDSIDKQAELDKQMDIDQKLTKHLPNYLQPIVVNLVDSFPYKPNGKIDKLRLINEAKLLQVEKFTDNELTNNLKAIWESVLGFPIVDISEDLAIFGASSINVMTASRIIQQAFGLATSEQALTVAKNKSILEQVNYLGYFRKESAKHRRKILLTGVTGFLGTQLLYDLFEDTSDEIICLIPNKYLNDTYVNKIRNNLVTLGLKYWVLDEANKNRIKFIRGDISKEKLGIREDLYAEYANSIDIIYHCAASVHHFYSSDDLRATNENSAYEIINFANEKTKKSIHFVSTLSTQLRDNLTTNGYIKSKVGAEEIFKKSAGKLNITIYRPGWIGWHSKTGGFLNLDRDHLMCLIRTCVEMRKYPNVKTKIHMIPVNILSKEILRISKENREKSGEYNLFLEVGWNEVFKAIDQCLNTGMKLEAVEYLEWHSAFRGEKILSKKLPLENFKEFYAENNRGLFAKTQYKAEPSKHLCPGFKFIRYWEVYSQTEKWEGIFNLLKESSYAELHNLLPTLAADETSYNFVKDIRDYSKNANQFSLLHLIIRNLKLTESQKTRIIQDILTGPFKDIEVNVLDRFGNSPAYESVVYKLNTVFADLVRKGGIRYEQTKDDRFNLLIAAANSGNVEAVNIVISELKKDQDLLMRFITQKDSADEHCLYKAITRRSSTIVSTILEIAKASKTDYLNMLGVQGMYSRPVLHHAAMAGDQKILDIMLESITSNNPELLVQPSKYGRFFIHFVKAKHFDYKRQLMAQYYEKMQKELHLQKKLNVTPILEIILDYEAKYVDQEMRTSKGPPLLTQGYLHESALGRLVNHKQSSESILQKLTSLKLDENGYAPFHYCIMFGLDLLIKDIIDYLKRHKQNEFLTKLVNCRTGNNDTPLHLALRENFNFYFSMDAQFPRKNYILFPNQLIVESLITNGAKINANNNHGMTPLYEAVFSSSYVKQSYSQAKTRNVKTDEGLIQYLVEKAGANLFELSEEQYTVLVLACRRSSFKICKYLLGAVKERFEQEELLDTIKPASPSKKSTIEKIPFYRFFKGSQEHISTTGHANKTSQSKAIQLTLKGVPVKDMKEPTDYFNFPNEHGQVALHFATMNENYRLTKLLLAASAAHSVHDYKYGNTPLHCAVANFSEEEHLKLIKLLVDNGADVHALKKHDRRAEDIIPYGAKEYEEDIKSILAKSGLEPNVKKRIDNKNIRISDQQNQTREGYKSKQVFTL